LGQGQRQSRYERWNQSRFPSPSYHASFEMVVSWHRHRCPPRLMLLCDLNEIATGVVKNRSSDRPYRHWRLREMDARFAQPVILGLHVLDAERRERNAVFNQGPLEWPGCRMLVRLK